MKTAEEILQKSSGFADERTLFEWEDVIKAMQEYANAKLDEAVNEFERLKPAESFTDIMYLDGVKAVISTIKDQI